MNDATRFSFAAALFRRGLAWARWLLAFESLPDEEPTLPFGGRMTSGAARELPRRSAWRWLLASEQLPAEPASSGLSFGARLTPAAQPGFFRWLLASEELSIGPEESSHPRPHWLAWLLSSEPLLPHPEKEKE